MLPESSKNTEWLFASICLFLAFLLIGFFGYLRFFSIASLDRHLQAEKKAMESAKAETVKILTPELRGLFEEYSDGLSSLQALFSAREDVFTGSLDPERFEPVMLLDFPAFFLELQKLLGKKTMLSNLTIDPIGRVSFLITTTSYFQAARQMEALEKRFASTPLLTDFEISSVGRKAITGKALELPEFLRQESSLTQFLVEAKINPEYYFALREEKEDAHK